MSGDVTTDELGPHEWMRFRAIRLRSLAEAPLASGSTLAEARAIPEVERARRIGYERVRLDVADLNADAVLL